MYAADEITQERVDEVVAALEQEKEGLEQRVKGAGSDADGKALASRLKGRIGEVDAEIKRWKDLGKKAPKATDAGDDGEA